MSLAQAVYTLDATDVADIGTAAGDIATSTFGVVGDILPVLVPLIVVYFGVRMVMAKVK